MYQLINLTGQYHGIQQNGGIPAGSVMNTYQLLTFIGCYLSCGDSPYAVPIPNKVTTNEIAPQHTVNKTVARYITRYLVYLSFTPQVCVSK